MFSVILMYFLLFCESYMTFPQHLRKIKNVSGNPLKLFSKSLKIEKFIIKKNGKIFRNFLRITACFFNSELATTLTISGIMSFYYSVGILLCELLNGVVPYIEKPPTLIMLEKLRGSQPLVMDQRTLGDSFASDQSYNNF